MTLTDEEAQRIVNLREAAIRQLVIRMNDDSTTHENRIRAADALLRETHRYWIRERAIALSQPVHPDVR